MSSDELHARQERRFSRIVAAGWRVPFYAKRWRAAGLAPGDIRGLDDLALLPERLTADRVTLSTLHVQSSCAMGGRRETSVADSFGAVWDADGLHVVGAAGLPGPTVVNPQGSIMAIAHRNALRFLEIRSRGGGRSARAPAAPGGDLASPVSSGA